MNDNIDATNITTYRLQIFNKEIKCRERIRGTPLSKMQKVKAARKVSHLIFPSIIYKGLKGHILRDEFKTEILKTVDVKYYPKL